MLHGCTIGAGCLIGIQSIVMNKVSIGDDCLVGAGTIVYALGIGPLSQLFLQLFTVPESRTPTDSGREAALSSKSA